MRKFLVVIMVAVAALAGMTACYDKHREPTVEEVMVEANSTIERVRSLATEEALVIDKEIVIAGIVTSDDVDSNFSRSLFIDDGTAGAEILIGSYRLTGRYPVGCRVAVKLQGLAISLQDGHLHIGSATPSYDSHPIGYIEPQVIADLHLFPTQSNTTSEPIRISLADNNSSNCGRLVALGSLNLAPVAEDSVVEGYHRYTDLNGNEVYLYIDSASTFASKPLPETATTVVGILTLEHVFDTVEQRLSLRPRYLSDYVN